MTDLDRLVPLRPGGTATPLFCVHSSSGSAYSYLELAQLLGDDQPVYGIEAPGFDDDRPPVRSLPALSAQYAQLLREFRPHGDFLLLGWSVGGTIALELARRLTAAGARVPLVVMIDVSVPVITELPSEKEITVRFLHEFLAVAGAEAAGLDQVVAGQPEDADGAAILLAAQRAGALPAELDADLLAGRYAVFRAHVEASYGFEVTEPYHGQVVHLIATQSPWQDLRWDKLAPQLTEHLVPGDHHSIWLGDSLARLAELTRSALADASPPRPESG